MDLGFSLRIVSNFLVGSLDFVYWGLYVHASKTRNIGASKASGFKITAPKLRKWFASEMATLGVDSTYIEAFCGRTPQSTLEKHYLDFSPRRLEEIYREAGITVLE